MTSEGTQYRPASALGFRRHYGRAGRNDDRRFRLALAVALLVHGLVLADLYAGKYAGKPRQVGQPGGLENAMSIDLATEADLHSNATVADQAGAKADTAVMPMPEAATVPPQPSPTTAEKSPPAAQAKAASPPAPVPPPADATAEPPVQSAGIPRGTGLPDPNTSDEKKAQAQRNVSGAPKHETKSSETKSAETPPPKHTPTPTPQLTAKLDLSLPPSAFSQMQFASTGAGIERPAGITRSGENDDFARGVVRALQRTMPQLRDTHGQVTVRITLDARGNLVTTQVVRPSPLADLNQMVVFATKQTSFPIPPKNAVPADLIFLVTYLYR